MKAVILAGGFGIRLAEETHLRSKPMIEIGGRPILWHIMNIYSAHGVNEFIIALGYKGEAIKEYFLNFYAFNSDISVDLSHGTTTIHHNGNQPNWKKGSARSRVPRAPLRESSPPSPSAHSRSL